MAKKIDNKILEHVKLLCYEVVLGEMIDQETRNNAKNTAAKFFKENDYSINWVKCDQENNPPDVVDSNRMIINVSEQVESGSLEEIIHTIEL
jgi:hypothetical protein